MSLAGQIEAPWQKWSQGTEIIVTGGVFKDLGGVIEAYDPMTQQFTVNLSDGRKVPLPANILSERTKTKAKDPLARRVIPTPKESLVKKPFKDKPLVTGPTENTQEAILRLAKRKKGMIISELLEVRNSKAKGPFQRSINRALKDNIVMISGERNGEPLVVLYSPTIKPVLKKATAKAALKPKEVVANLPLGKLLAKGVSRTVLPVVSNSNEGMKSKVFLERPVVADLVDSFAKTLSLLAAALRSERE